MYLWGDYMNTQAKIQMLKIKQAELWRSVGETRKIINARWIV